MAADTFITQVTIFVVTSVHALHISVDGLAIPITMITIPSIPAVIVVFVARHQFYQSIIIIASIINILFIVNMP